MDLTTFEAQIREIVNEGTSFDLAISSSVRKAARWIERNFDFPYMNQSSLYPISTGVDSIALDIFNSVPTPTIKRLVALQLSDASTFLNDITIIDALELTAKKRNEFSVPGPPKFASIRRDFLESASGSDTVLALYPIPDVAYVVYLSSVRFTDPWISSGSHWLLNNAEDLMEALAIGFLAPVVRDPELIQFYAAIKAEAVKTLKISNTQFSVELEDTRGQYAGENLS